MNRNWEAVNDCRQPGHSRFFREMRTLVLFQAVLTTVALFSGLFLFPTSAAAPSTKYFEFRNGFWMNLHHTLFREAIVGKTDQQTRERIGLVALSDVGLSEQEKQAWGAAVH